MNFGIILILFTIIPNFVIFFLASKHYHVTRYQPTFILCLFFGIQGAVQFTFLPITWLGPTQENLAIFFLISTTLLIIIGNALIVAFFESIYKNSFSIIMFCFIGYLGFIIGYIFVEIFATNLWIFKYTFLGWIPLYPLDLFIVLGI